MPVKLGVSAKIVELVTPIITPFRVISNEACSGDVHVHSNETSFPETIEVRFGHGNGELDVSVTVVELLAPDASVTESTTSIVPINGIRNEVSIPEAPPPDHIHWYRTIALSGSVD